MIRKGTDTQNLHLMQIGTKRVVQIFLGEDIAFAKVDVSFDEQGGSAVSDKTVY